MPRISIALERDPFSNAFSIACAFEGQTLYLDAAIP